MRTNLIPQLGNPLSIEARDLSVTIGGEKILDEVSFTVNPGEYMAVVGPSGSGKSTLGYALLGLLDKVHQPNTGEVIYDDVAIYSELNARQRTKIISKHFGYVPQTANLIPGMTARDNILIKARLNRFPIEEEKLVRQIAILGIAGKLDQKASTLSGGEQRRVAIARALATNPGVVLLDEPTAGLHADQKDTLNGLIDDLAEAEDRTVIVITHEATNAPRTLNLDSGLLVADSFNPPLSERPQLQGGYL